MNSSKAPQYLLCAALIAIGIGNAQTTVKPVPAKPTVAVDGKTLFHDYCAVCHGADGKGKGPAALALKVPPTDLTQVSHRNAGSFPEDRILKIIRGEESLPAHGTKDMPMWGAIFNNMSPNPSMTQTRIHALLQYVESVQTK